MYVFNYSVIMFCTKERILFLFSSFMYLASFTKGSESDYDGPQSITFYHSLSPGLEVDWQPRGHISVQNVLGGGMSQQVQNVALQQPPFDSESITALKSLADEDKFYRLKAVVKTTQGREIEFFSFVKACALVESQLEDFMTVSIDHEGSIVAVTQSTPLNSCGSVHVDRLPMEFNTSIRFKAIEHGPIPDTASYIQKIEREREARERGETKDNRSFLAKYWMYIIPIVIFVVLSGASNPDGAGPA